MPTQEVREIALDLGVSQSPPKLQSIVEAAFVTCAGIEVALYRAFEMGRCLPFPEVLPAHRVVDGALQPLRLTQAFFAPALKDATPL